MSGELLEFVASDGRIVSGLVQNLEEDEVGAVLLGDVTAIKENDQVRTTGKILEVPVGKAMLGRVVNVLGQPIDGKGPIETTATRPVEFKAPGVHERQPVEEPMQTGILAVDSMIPIGRGQRELIMHGARILPSFGAQEERIGPKMPTFCQKLSPKDEKMSPKVLTSF